MKKMSKGKKIFLWFTGIFVGLPLLYILFVLGATQTGENAVDFTSEVVVSVIILGVVSLILALILSALISAAINIKKDRAQSRLFLIVLAVVFVCLLTSHSVMSVKLKPLKMEFQEAVRDGDYTIDDIIYGNGEQRVTLDYGGSLTDITEKRKAFLRYYRFVGIGGWHSKDYSTATVDMVYIYWPFRKRIKEDQQ